MKKHTTTKQKIKNPQRAKERRQIRRILTAKEKVYVGLDLGDRTSRYCILDDGGNIVSEGQIATTKEGLKELFGKMPGSRIAFEVGTHSPWVNRELASMGHEVVVANAHNVKLITQSVRKTDRIDARKLARLVRVDPQLLSPIRHRGERAQKDLMLIRARAELMELRTSAINSARGLVKPLGERLKKCDADQVNVGMGEGLSEAARAAVLPMLKLVEEISGQIGKYDEQIEEMAKGYPEIKLLRAVHGVGQLIALTFVLTLEDPGRFAHSRDVGAYLGLTRKQRDSGKKEPELGISKTGDVLVRSLLVQGAHCILRKGAPQSDLRVWGEGLMGKGGKRAKRRAIVAVARKLGVLLHHLWATGEVYDPQYNRKAAEAAAKTRGKASAKAAA